MPTDLRARIQTALLAFADGPLAASSIDLLEVLGYRSERRLVLKPNSPANFERTFTGAHVLNPEQARIGEWTEANFLLQLTDSEVAQTEQLHLLREHDGWRAGAYGSFAFLAIGLAGQHYSRTALATITRAVNRLFMMPTPIFFRYGDKLTLAIILRRPGKRDTQRDVLAKVTLIKDIDLRQPHAAHIRILEELALANLRQGQQVGSFDELQSAWAKTLDISELNKRFYQELANWYHWAVTTVHFPPGDGQEEAETRHAVAVIRLITRLIFVWFIKEKGLVPAALFDRAALDALLTWDDPQQSTYYKAILQNLFFATLNTEMERDKPGSRRFRSKPTAPNAHYGVPSRYRYQARFTDPAAALRRFADIPFLNGGLFECLDRPDAGVRIDGFSDRPDNPLRVPDELFFGVEHAIDLNEVFGTRNKQYKVRGLLDIFARYKFTVEENTPIEEEVALDPELLGKVFENLLAAYNPETRTTARKQTGSFYTPREIVDYMVDEALIATLAEKVGGAGGEFEARLRQLFAYTDDAHQFTPAEVAALIDAIDALKMLDPACGSGAFPMGILHKLVFILRKLDPNNVRWKAQQLARAERDRELAEQMEDEQIREHAVREADARIAEIRHSFDQADHELDYTRKLYLIENCIYGVDIQPIAVQIAKLRCFISLVADQRVDDAAPNRNVRALPNLETKFVAANSLISIVRPAEQDKPAAVTVLPTAAVKQKVNELVDVFAQYCNVTGATLKAKWLGIGREVCDELNALLAHDASVAPLNADWLFPTTPNPAALRALLPGDQPVKGGVMLALRNPAIEQLEAELRRVRKNHFTAKTTQTKRKHREADARLRQQLSELLEGDGWNHDITVLLAQWNPYDQHTHAEFFDPEWMFGITEGFDIVIGNPPYVRQEQLGALKPRLQAQYDCYTGTADLYVYFFERGLRLLHERGVLTYISPNKYFRAGYGAKLRGYLASQTRIVQLTDFGDAPVFTAIAYPSIIVTQRMAAPAQQLRALTWPAGAPLEEFADAFRQRSFLIAQRELTADGWRLEVPSVLRLMEKLRAAGKPLGEYVEGRFYYGVKTGLNDAFVVDSSTKDRLIAEHPLSAEVLRPFLRGRDVKRWRVDFRDNWLVYVPWHFPLHFDNSIKGASSQAEQAFSSGYPAIYQHLLRFKTQLENRNVDETGLRYEWYAMQRWGAEYWREFNQNKIIWRAVAEEARGFGYDVSGSLSNDTTYFLPTDRMVLLAFLNSSLCGFFLDQICDRVQAGYLRVKSIYLGQVPIAETTPELQHQLELYVDAILARKAQDPAADVRAQEAEIDALVYRLYGLTAAEIKIVEGAG
jgi:hypothetical protein